MTKIGWLTPDALPGALRECVLQIPDSEEFKSLVLGALYLLSQDKNYEAFGALSPTQTADAMRRMLFSFLEDGRMTLPVGTVLEYAGNSLPTSFLWANGDPVSRATYAELFAVIGDGFGVGDGSTTFNLPDKRGRVGVGVNEEIEPPLSLSDWGGDYVHTLTLAETPAHVHPSNINNATGSAGPPYRFQYVGLGDPTNNLPTGTAGGGGAHNNMQPYLVVNYIIKF